MFDGTVRAVEDILVGDLLMGPDSLPRKVLELYRGREKMYRVVPVKGDPFEVNESHILSLKKTCNESNHRTSEDSRQGRKRRSDFQGYRPIVNTSVREYLPRSKTFKHCHKLYRVGVDFPQAAKEGLPIPPYILGLWLGNGSKTAACVTCSSPETLAAWDQYGLSLGLSIRTCSKPGCEEHYITTGQRGGGEGGNPLVKKLRALRVWDNKHIPPQYLVASKEDRLELLAGLLDTDGSLTNGCYDFVQKIKAVSEGASFLARSLGLAAYMVPCTKKCQTGAEGEYFRVCISGNTDVIPLRVPYKKSTKRLQLKDALVTGFKLQELLEDDYYGFELTGDHLYLLGDFTVTHNTGKSPLAITVAKALISLLGEFDEDIGLRKPRIFVGEDDPVTYPFQVWIVTQNKLLQDQYNRDFSDQVFDLRGIDNYQCYHDDATCGQSKCARLRPPKGLKGWKPPQYCSRACQYDEARAQSRYAPILLLNVAKALALLKDPSQPAPVVMIFDEGHGVEGALDSEASTTIDPKTLESLDLRFEKYFQELDDIDAITVGFKKLRKAIVTDMELECSMPPDGRDSKKLKRLEGLARKIDFTLASMDAGIQFVSCSMEKVDLRPLKVHALFERTFTFPTLFLSATLLSHDGFCAMTGVDPETMSWFSLDSPFPIENREIFYWWRLGSRAINYQNQATEMENLLYRVQEVLDRHPGERGIIHTHTYKIAQDIVAKLPQYGRRFLFPKNAKEQKAALEEHARSTNTVLISPSMTEGVDLKDDLCRFAALCKVPYLPMGDPVVAARMDANPDWYSYRTAMTVVQAPGRGVRSETDHAVTYLLDPGFQPFVARSRKHFPKWFLDSIVKGYKGGY